MLAALTVRDIVLIESAALEFAPGLNVLTGETGAGKSILLDALGSRAGGRGGGRAAVRPGAAQGSAVAVFEPSPKAPLIRAAARAGHGGGRRDRPSPHPRRRRPHPRLHQRRAGRRGAAEGPRRAAAGGPWPGRRPRPVRRLHPPRPARRVRRPRCARRGNRVALRGPRPRAPAEAELKRLASEAAADADYVRSAADELSALSPRKGRRGRARLRTRAADERRAHRRGRFRRVGRAVGRARRGSVSRHSAQAAEPQRSGCPPGRRRGGGRPRTGLRPHGGGAARAGRVPVAAGARPERAGAQGRAAVRAARCRAQIRRRARPAARSPGGLPRQTRGDGDRRRGIEGRGAGRFRCDGILCRERAQIVDRARDPRRGRWKARWRRSSHRSSSAMQNSVSRSRLWTSRARTGWSASLSRSRPSKAPSSAR